MPHDKNISDSRPAWRPNAYSLTMRQEGENSGLRMCSRTSSRMVAPVATMDIQAAAGCEE